MTMSRRIFLGAGAIVWLMARATSCFSAVSTRNHLRMDTEGIEHQHVQNIILPTTSKLLTIPSSSVAACPIQEAHDAVGMPWQTSLDDKKDLTYMEFWKWQVNFMKRHLTNLQVTPATNLNATMDFSLQANQEARIVNLCFESSEYRKIRMTYYDAGHKTQVFNSLWYPRANLPVLGIDLLQFHGKKHLAVVDFQPLYQEEDKHDAPYEHLLKPIKSQYPALQGKVSKRFYDETQFFSQQMLFARFEDESVVDQQLFPAFHEYVSTHARLTKSVSPQNYDIPWTRHAAYDVYSAERDPAKNMFEKQFGKEWSEEYVHGFLFDQSRSR